MINKNFRVFYLLISLSAFAGMALVFYATTSGPGVGGDATIYLVSARNFLAGKGLGWIEADGSFRLLPYTPPFYPLVLGFLGLVGNMVSGARLVNILLFGGLAALLGLTFIRYTGNGWLGVILSGLVALSPVLLGVHVWAMSEPLFLFLGFSGLIVLFAYLESGRRRILFTSALLCGLAFLTRYMGLAYIAAGGLALLFLGREEESRVKSKVGGRELTDAVLFGIVSLLPIIVWFIVDFSITGTVGSRSGQPASAYWQRFLEMGPALMKIYLFWLIPDSVSNRLPAFAQLLMWLVPVLLLGILAFLAIGRIRQGQGQVSVHGSASIFSVTRPALRMLLMFLLFLIVYMVVLAVAQVFTYPPITLASRMLSPAHLAVLVCLPALLLLAAQTLFPRSSLAVVLISIGLLGLLGTYGLRSIMIARDYHGSGIGYNSSAWRNSPTIVALQSIPPDIPLISNEVTAIMFLGGRSAYTLQEIYQDLPVEPYTVYGSGEDESQKIFREQNGALVLFKTNLRDDFAMYGDRVEERLARLTAGLYLYYESEDGAIYFSRQPEFSRPR